MATEEACKRFAKHCEKSMLNWLNDTTKSNFKDLKEFNNPQAQAGVDVKMADGFQFDNSFDVIDETGFALSDEMSSDEEEA